MAELKGVRGKLYKFNNENRTILVLKALESCKTIEQQIGNTNKKPK
jgi:hypothetical protein